MTNPADTLNPEVMKDGNSGYKLQLAMGPNQLIQDEMVKNCAVGLKDLIYIVWKTMIQYSDDYNIQQLAEAMLPGSGGFLDAKSMENFEFIDRNMINVDLALGFLSDENRLTRQQLITQAQQQFAGILMQLDPSVPEMFEKARRPFEDTLYALGVKHCDSYLPTFEEAVKMFQAKQASGPGMAEQEVQSKVELNKAKTQESATVAALNMKKAEDIDMDNYFETQAMKAGKLSAVQVD
jgi:thiol-disulfide isomerase/thioredoxin